MKMIPETLYKMLHYRIKMGGKTRSVQTITQQLQNEAPSAVRFNLSGKEENTPGISVDSPLTVLGGINGNAWIFYLEENNLINLFSFTKGKSVVSIARMSKEVANKLKGYRETLTQPFKRGEGLPSKCTRVYRLPLAPNGTPEAHEIRVLAYHFPDTGRDYLRLNFLRREAGTNDWNIEPVAEIKKVHGHPHMLTSLPTS